MGAPADLCGQEFVTFSKLINDSLPIVFKNIVVQENGYLATALCANIDTAYYYNLSAYNFDLNGEIIDVNRFGSSSQSLFTLDMNTELSDGTVVNVTVDFAKEIATACLVWLSPNGDSIQTRNYTSPIYIQGDSDTEWFVPQDIASDAFDNIYPLVM
jgi:hypothetical protein